MVRIRLCRTVIVQSERNSRGLRRVSVHKPSKLARRVLREKKRDYLDVAVSLRAISPSRGFFSTRARSS